MSNKYFKEIAKSLRGRDVIKHNTTEKVTSAAVMMMLKESAHDFDALFIQRSVSNSDAFSGHMAFPGGKKQKEDQTLLDTAIRETYEEVGIRLEKDKSLILGELDDCKPNNPKARNMVVTPFVTHLSRNARVKPDNSEVADYVWIPVSILFDQYKNNLSNYGPDYNKKRFEYRYENYYIWGLTGRIVTQFMDLTSHLF